MPRSKMDIPFGVLVPKNNCWSTNKQEGHAATYQRFT